MQLDAAIATLLEKLMHPALPEIDLSLDRMHRLLALLGNPQRRLPKTVHVAGTNGKGSTIAYLKAMMESQGLRVHAYTSPHLVRFNERIVLAGAPIANRDLLPLLHRVAMAAEQVPVTFFEATTAAALLAFASVEADYLLLEVGLGGRLDATNVIAPVLSIITPVGLDHQEYLGATLAAIAREKAGILKPGVPAIFGRQETEATRALAHAGPSYREGDAWHYHPGKVTLDVTFDGTTRRMALPPLAGEHQCHNAALAVVAMQVLGLKTPRDSLRAARWPGRLQQLTRGPLVKAWGAPLWLDGAHNAHAARALAEWARQQPGLRMLVCGLLARKDADAFFEALGDAFDAIVTIPVPGTTDAHTARHLAALAGPRAHAAASWEGVMAQLRRYQPATVVIAGSLYLAGAILKYHE